MIVLLLDAYHLGDPLFLTGLARDLKTRGGGAVLVHGTAERGEHALEGLGLHPEAVSGVWDVPTSEAAVALERAGRDLNREIAHEINEAGVASVRVIGADRGLLRLSDDHLEVGQTGWVDELVRQGVVVVVAALVAKDAEALHEVDAAAAAAVLADRLGVPVGVLSVGDGGPPPDREAARRLHAWGTDVVTLDRAELRGGGKGAGATPGGQT